MLPHKYDQLWRLLYPCSACSHMTTFASNKPTAQVMVVSLLPSLPLPDLGLADMAKNVISFFFFCQID